VHVLFVGHCHPLDLIIYSSPFLLRLSKTRQ
jgi:hypothetical protein